MRGGKGEGEKGGGTIWISRLTLLQHDLEVLVHVGLHFNTVEEIRTVETGDERYGVV
jgi:hypothetical protein